MTTRTRRSRPTPSQAPPPTGASRAGRWWLVGVTTLLFACDEAGPPPVIDRDGDQWVADADCDDRNPNVHPFADELCNGVDDDCDGETDESHAIDPVPFYADSDGDGYGDGAVVMVPSGARPTHHIRPNRHRPRGEGLDRGFARSRSVGSDRRAVES